MTNHITIPRALLEQALEVIVANTIGKDDIEAAIRAELAKPAPTPAWHDAPEVAALKAERDALLKDAERYRWLTTHARTTSEHWGGRWSIVIDGPAPERHDCKDALDEAIDAAIAKAEGRTE